MPVVVSIIVFLGQMQSGNRASPNVFKMHQIRLGIRTVKSDIKKRKVISREISVYAG